MFEQLANPWWVFVLLGIFAGTLSGMLGIGGGVILVPTLVIALGFAQKSAQGMSLAIMVPLALVGAIRYKLSGDVDLNLLVIGLIVAGAIAGTLMGTEIEHRVPSHLLRKLFSVILVIVAVKMFIGPSKPPGSAAGDNVSDQNNISVVESGGTD
jgi:hypothetical protein